MADNSFLHHRFKSNSFNLNDEDPQGLLDQDEEFEEKFTEKRIDNIPWRGITLALVLALIGTFIIVVFICSQMGWIEFKPDDNFTFLTLAFITLVPGFYHCFIAFRAYRGYEGYSFDDIADLN